MSRLSKNIIYNLIGQGILVFIGFVAVKYVFNELGGDALGIIYFNLTLTSILSGVLSKGLLSTSIREVSIHHKKDPDYIKKFIQTGSLLSWMAYIGFSFILYFGAPVLVNHWINLSTMDNVTATYILRILGIAALLSFPASFYASLLQGLQRMGFTNIIDVCAASLQQFGIVLILVYGGDIFRVASWIALCYAIRLIAYVITCSRFYPLRSFVPWLSRVVVTRNFRFASSMFTISVLAMVNKQVDKVIISMLLPIVLLGYYGFVYGALSKGSLLASSVAQAAYPSLCSSFENNEQERVRSQYFRLQDFVCFVTVPVFALFVFAATPLLTNVFNPEVAHTLHYPVILLSLGFYLNGTLAVPYRLSLASGRPDITVRLTFYSLFTVLPANVLLVSFFSLSGAALGWVLYFLFTYAYSVPKIYRECLKMPPLSFFVPLLKIVLLALMSYGAAYGILVFTQATTIFALLSAYCAASAFFLAAGFLVSTKELRETIIRNFQGAFPKTYG